MKPNKIQSNEVKWDPHTFYDEEFDPLIPVDGEEDDTYEAGRVNEQRDPRPRPGLKACLPDKGI